MNQIDIVHHFDAEAPQELHNAGIVEIVIRRAKNIRLANNGGLGDKNIVSIPYRNGQGGVEGDDVCDIAQKSDVLVDAAFGQAMELAQTRIAESLAVS